MPAAQSLHDATFDAVEYLPAAHSVHDVAPVLAPVSVIAPAEHGTQFSLVAPVSALLYVPALQRPSQLLVLDPPAPKWPAGQKIQSAASSDPGVATYLPAAQSLHDATFDAVENLPASHSVHVVAPSLEPVSVIEPASHGMQAVELSSSTYLPPGHAAQLVAPMAGWW